MWGRGASQLQAAGVSADPWLVQPRVMCAANADDDRTDGLCAESDRSTTTSRSSKSTYASGAAGEVALLRRTSNVLLDWLVSAALLRRLILCGCSVLRLGDELE